MARSKYDEDNQGNFVSKDQLPAALDAQQKKVLKGVTRQIQDAALNTEPMDRAFCQQAIERSYAHQGLASPTVLFLSSPQAIMRHLLGTASEAVEGTGQPSVDFSQLLGAEDDLQTLVLKSMGSAQPRALAGWGSEVSLPAHDLESDVILPFTWHPGWERFSQAVDQGVGNLIHFEHAITEALEAMVGDENDEWLIYSGGMNNLWGSAEALGRAQALFELGLLSEAPPALLLGNDVLRNCGWVNAFEKLCLVSDRPELLEQTGATRGPQGLQTRVVWRDGEVSQYTYQD